MPELVKVSTDRPPGDGLSSSRRAVLAAERQRIADTLHDSLGALLFGIGATVADLRCEPGLSPPLRQRLHELQEQVAASSAALRQALTGLSEHGPVAGLWVSVQGDCDAFAARTGIEIRCLMPAVLTALGEARSAAVLAVVREALLNVEKHAGATSVVVNFVLGDELLRIDVSDDGVGPDARQHAPPSSGLGLEAAHTRLARLGGALTLFGRAGGGSTTRAWIPTT